MTVNANIDHAEIRCLMMMGKRAKAMAFYTVMFGFTITLLKNPEELNELAATVVVALFGLISIYYLLMQGFITRERFKLALAGVQDDTTRGMIKRENCFRRLAYSLFIVLAFLFVFYLGFFNG